MMPERDPKRLKMRFLFLAGGMLAAAVLVYVVMAALPPVDPTGLVAALQTFFALVLLLVVAFALLFLLAATSTRLAGFLADRGQYLVDLWRVPFRFIGFGGFFDSDPLAEKAIASERKRARVERRRLARATRPRGRRTESRSDAHESGDEEP